MNTIEMNSSETAIPQSIPAAKAEATSGLVREAQGLLKSMGRVDSSAVLENEATSLKDSPYRIAVIGEFKTGKSTFINAAFLGEELLFSDTMEATCVPTELAWGEQPMMKIFPYQEESYPTVEGSSSIRLRAGEQAAVEVPSPTPKDIRMETSADTADDREFKARKISKVRVESPRPSLRGITVLDSPGINSTSGAVVDAALRIVPSCDSVIFVTRGGQLSESEEAFLRSGVLDQGISRAIVVINHFDSMTPLSAEGRKEHLEALQAKLRALGKGHLQVTMVDAKGWLDAIVKGEPVPGDAADFSKELGEFLVKDLAKARLEKTMDVTKREIRSALVELAAVTAMREKTEAERAQIAETLATKSEEANTRLEYVRQDFEAEFIGHLNQFRNTLKSGITTTVNKFKAPLRKAPDFASMGEELASMQSAITPEIESCYINATRTLKRDLQSTEERFSREIRNAIAHLDSEMLPELGTGISLPPIPGPVIAVLDYLLVVIASPLPMVADIILRMLADRFPEVRKIMPSGLVKSMALNWIEKQLDQQTAATLDEIERRVESIRVDATNAVSKSIESLVEGEIAPLKKALRSLEDGKSLWSPKEVSDFNRQLRALYEQATSMVA